jgi:ubiquinone/menaquinone biosynthesis C-methylase UbiE
MEKEEVVKKDWDEYWSRQGTSTSEAYNFFANFYRNRIIKPFLNHFIFRHFPKGANLLHAGCGSGMVDKDVLKQYQVTALDISPEALEIYKRINQGAHAITLGNIFSLPFSNDSFDGIYNLGVMEHFTEDEIRQVLIEFKRVLKVKGKIILLIPPVFGLTVQVLDIAHFVLNRILRKNVKLHPDEITRVRSQKHIRRLIEESGFKFIEYYFGHKDAFTQIVIVGEK